MLGTHGCTPGAGCAMRCPRRNPALHASRQAFDRGSSAAHATSARVARLWSVSGWRPLGRAAPRCPRCRRTRWLDPQTRHGHFCTLQPCCPGSWVCVALLATTAGLTAHGFRPLNPWLDFAALVLQGEPLSDEHLLELSNFGRSLIARPPQLVINHKVRAWLDSCDPARSPVRPSQSTALPCPAVKLPVLSSLPWQRAKSVSQPASQPANQLCCTH